MGLDNFDTSNNEDEDQDEDIEDEGVENDDEEIKEEEVEEQKDIEDESQDDSPSGLDAFRTDDKSKSVEEEKDREDSMPWRHDFSAYEWNEMTTEEKVKYVRENYDPSYRPEIELNKEWTYNSVVEVNCVCENSFTFQSSGICLSCGRAYQKKDNIVVMKQDIEEGDGNGS